MANSLSYQFSPVIFDLKKRMREELKGNQYKIMDTIADEIYLFPDTRNTLSKELASRYLAKKTNICQPLVVTALNKLEKRKFIRIVKSHVKGEGSIITILLDNILISNRLDGTTLPNKSDNKTLSNFSKSDSTTLSNSHKSDSTTLSNQENISKEKDIKNQICPPMISSLPPSPSPDDDVTAIDKREEKRKEKTEKIIEVPAAEPIKETKPLNYSSNSLPPATVNQASSKQNPINPLFPSIPANSINTVDNFILPLRVPSMPVPPAPTAPVTVQGNPLASSRVQVPPAPVPQGKKEDKEFSSLGDILPGSFKLDTSKYSATVPGIPGVSADTMIKGKIILIEKNLTEKEINMVFDRVSKAITAGNVDEWKRNKYVLNACTNEQERTPAPEKSLDEKEREKFIEKVNSDFRTGKVKYVLSSTGEKQPITEMDNKCFLYWKGRTPAYAIFEELAKKAPQLLNERFFVGD